MGRKESNQKSFTWDIYEKREKISKANPHHCKFGNFRVGFIFAKLANFRTYSIMTALVPVLASPCS